MRDMLDGSEAFVHPDRMAEVAHGHWLRAHLPDSELRLIPGDHGAVTFGAAEAFFATLAAG